jgi:hypothetical protein
MRTLQIKLFWFVLVAPLLTIGLEHAIPVIQDFFVSRSVDGSDAAIPLRLYRRMRQKLEVDMPDSADAEFRALRVGRRLFSDGRKAWVVCGEFRLPGDVGFQPLVYIDRRDFRAVPSTLAEAFPVRNEQTAPIVERELKHWAMAERVGCIQMHEQLQHLLSGSEPNSALSGQSADLGPLDTGQH